MVINKLSARQILNAEPGKHEDGAGLRLIVSKKSSKRWELRFTFNNKRREMGLGAYPTVSLSDARLRAHEARKLVSQGVDPIKANKAPKIPTFTEISARYLRSHRNAWSRNHAKAWVRSITTDAKHHLGAKRIDRIDTEDILKTFTPIWNIKPVSAKRLQSRIENILDYASAHQYREQFNPARWKGHLDKLLPNPKRLSRVSHFTAMPYQDCHSLMGELQKNESFPSKALQLLILTATRSDEVRYAKWTEINLDDGIWTIPSERMKSGREHRIPLADQALKLINSLPKVLDNPYLFPGHKIGKPINHRAKWELLRRKMEYTDVTVHGFRSSFRDWAGETTNFPNHVVEMALAHAIKNSTEAAYRRGDLFNKRRTLMESWSNYLDPKTQS